MPARYMYVLDVFIEKTPTLSPAYTRPPVPPIMLSTVGTHRKKLGATAGSQLVVSGAGVPAAAAAASSATAASGATAAAVSAPSAAAGTGPCAVGAGLRGHKGRPYAHEDTRHTCAQCSGIHDL